MFLVADCCSSAFAMASNPDINSTVVDVLENLQIMQQSWYQTHHVVLDNQQWSGAARTWPMHRPCVLTCDRGPYVSASFSLLDGSRCHRPVQIIVVFGPSACSLHIVVIWLQITWWAFYHNRKWLSLFLSKFLLAGSKSLDTGFGECTWPFPTPLQPSFATIPGILDSALCLKLHECDWLSLAAL